MSAKDELKKELGLDELKETLNTEEAIPSPKVEATLSDPVHQKEAKELAESAGPIAPNNDALGNAAAATLASAETEGDPPSEADVDLDYEFLDYDPTEVAPHLKRAGLTPEAIDELHKNFAFRWCATDHRILDKRLYAGWEIFSPAVKRGDLVLCKMPIGRRNAMARQMEKKKTARYDAAMNRVEHEASKMAGQGISTFDDESGPSIRR